MDMAIFVFRDTGIALGDDRTLHALGGKAQHGAQQVRRADTAIGTIGDRRIGQALDHLDHRLGGHAHHRAACRVEGHGSAPGHVGQGKGLCRGLVFLGGRDRFQPQDIRAAFLQALGLFVEHLDRQFVGQRPHRHHDVPGRPDRTGDHDGPARRIGDLAAQFGPKAVQLPHAVLAVMQLQAGRVAAEGVGQEDVAARIHGVGIQLLDPVRVIHVPEFRCIARRQAHVEQVGPGCPVGHQPVTGFKQAGKSVGHIILRAGARTPWPAHVCPRHNVPVAGLKGALPLGGLNGACQVRRSKGQC